MNHRFQAKGVTSLAAALSEGEAYLRAQRLQEEDSRTGNRPSDGTPMADAAGSLHTAADRLLTLMTQAMMTLAGVRTPSKSAHPEASRRKPPSNSRKPRRPPRPREPGKERRQGEPRQASVRTQRHVHQGWQTPRKTGRSPRPREAFQLPLANRFSQLPHVELAGEVHPDIGGEYSPPRQKGLTPRDPQSHPRNGLRPVWLRLGLLGK